MKTKIFAVLLLYLATVSAQARQTPLGGTPVSQLLAKAQAEGEVPVIVGVGFGRDFAPEGSLSAIAVEEQRDDIRAAQDVVAERYDGSVTHIVDTIPYLLMSADVATLDALAEDEDVFSLEEDTLMQATLDTTTQQIRAQPLWGNNFGGLTGNGWTIAFIDTGAETGHPFFGGRIAGEACFSRANSTGVSSTCQNGTVDTSLPPGVIAGTDTYYRRTGAGAGAPCNLQIAECFHGTATAGVAIGRNGLLDGRTFSGVANGAKVLPIQAAHIQHGIRAVFYMGDVLRALVYLHEGIRQNTIQNVAAVNISVAVLDSADENQERCDRGADPTMTRGSFATAVANLRSIGVPVVIGSGNQRDVGAAFPSCVSAAISVGAVTKQNSVWERSAGEGTNSGTLMDLWAPGAGSNNRPENEPAPALRGIATSFPNGTYGSASGTSIAAPHVAGAFALLRQQWPNAYGEALVNALLGSGARITDPRPNALTVTRRLLDVTGAVESLARADFNKDALGDLLWENGSTNAVWFVNLTALRPWIPASHRAPFLVGTDTLPSTPAGWHVVGTGDFNGNRSADLLLHNASSGEVAVWFRNGKTYVALAVIAGTAAAPWSAGAVGDFNADGWPDILWRNGSTGANAIWLMNQTAVSSVITLPTNADLAWRIAGAGHFNDDEALDLVWRNDSTDSNAVWFLTSSHQIQSTALLSPTGAPGWRLEMVGDFDRDGHEDLVWRNSGTNAVAAWMMNGTAVRESISIGTADASWKIVGPR
jgi:subtilisin family serine protease